MENKLKYIPIFRSKQQEINVLRTFEFNDQMFPCLEIIKEIDREPRQTNSNKQESLFGKKEEKTFSSCYTSIIESIKSEKIFVDLPNHLKTSPNMNSKSLQFFTKVIGNREKRTDFILRLKHLKNKIIPVVSTYLQISGEVDSIQKQYKDLKRVFESIAYRIMIPTFDQDLAEVRNIIRKNDFLLIDLEEDELDENDWQANLVKRGIRDINAHKIIIRNQIPTSLTMSSLKHRAHIDKIDNSLPFIFQKLGGHGFSDYVGIKKDNITTGGIQSPGFIFYDAVQNSFFGYRYQFGGHKKGQIRPNPEEFETTIVPAVLNSEAVSRMKNSKLDFLNCNNRGWETLKRINSGNENGKSPAKFKRISMEHYLYCIRKKIIANEIG